MSEKEEDTKKSELKIKNVAVLTATSEVFGLPSYLFGIGGVFGLVFGVLISWWAGIAVAGCYYKVMYDMHQDDLNGLQVFRRSMFRSCTSWIGGDSSGQKLEFL